MNERDSFAILISNNFDEIVRNFKSGLKNQGYIYDEDILADTFVKCNSKLCDKEMTKSEAIKYFWTAYINRLKNDSKKKNRLVEYSGDFDRCAEQYDPDIDKLYSLVTTEISKKFGSGVANLWIDYACNHKTYKDIAKDSGEVDGSLHYILKKIKKYIRQELPLNNTEYNEIINNIRTT